MKKLNTSLEFSKERRIDSCNIITLTNNETSTKLASRCFDSCIEHKIPNPTYFEAFDGTGEDIIIPESLEDQWFLNWLKKPNNRYSNSQIACFFSHFALWAKCATIDKPIIILEHDAVCIQNIQHHKFYNCIQYLGCNEQKEGAIISSIPPHASIYEGHWRSICRAHAYLIDPPTARNLLSYSIREGMTKTLDIFIRCDIFPIIQDGLYFYDKRGVSTINELEDYSTDC